MDEGAWVLELEHAAYWRGERTILTGIDWRIRRGQHWALLGANGSGKTTLLKMVAAIEWPCDGHIRVLGQRFGEVDLRELRRSIGVVSSALVPYFQDRQPALAIVETGIDAELGWWRTFDADAEARARAGLAALGIAALADNPYGQLSQGEKQRVLIARALMNAPHLLILDEPCAGLDPAARESFLEDLGRFVERPETPTLVIVTHHIEEIPAFVRHALVLKDGRTLAQGAIAEVLRADVLGEAFGRRCRVEHTSGGRYRLHMD
jgi:iron complex transport system ATP-binding protein